ncbi:helix-turn-helix domain-containing protein [Variovorax sp. YR752]|uniref:AraC-like ligand-binding domain-containing protein n=1 Tax=Variovorax sp. YR752 TaxID=1884383 RepID=UPI003138423F
MPPTAPPLRRWSTDAAPAGERMDYWIDAVCEGFLEMDVTSAAPERFAAELVSAPLGALQLNRVRGSAQDVYRTGRALARSRQDCYYLLCKTDTPWSAAQHGREARLRPGDLLLVDSRHRYQFHFDQTCNTVSIELPTAWVAQWLADPAQACGRRLDGQDGFGAALSAFARVLQPELALAPPAPAMLLTDQLGALLALACGDDPPRADDAAALRVRITAAVRERHAEPGLTAATVAAQLGIGERSLHRALAGQGATFAQQLMACRIDAARRLLADSRFDRLTAAEIGRRVGLLDASHFVRVYRQGTGLTPGAWRRARGGR